MAVDIYTHPLQLTKGNAVLRLRNNISTDRKQSTRLKPPNEDKPVEQSVNTPI